MQSKMTLNIPEAQASLRPFFAEVRRYLLNEMDSTNMTQENRRYHDHINLVYSFASSINPDVITIETLLDGLSQTGQSDSETIAIYKDRILDGLIRYLIQLNQDGNNALMLATLDNLEAVQTLLNAMPEASRQRVFEQVNLHGFNALMLASFDNLEAVQPLLNAMPELSKQRVFEQVSRYGWNALMIAADYHPEIVQPLLEAMPETSKQRVFEQVKNDGYNVLMMAARFHAEVVQPLLEAMPETSKQWVFEQVNHEGYNVLMIAARCQPEIVQSLLEAMPEASKQRVFEQVTQHGSNALMLAARNHPEAVQPLLAAMPQSLRQLTFQYEDNQRFTYGSKIIQSLFAHDHIHSVLTLLQEGVLPLKGKAFKEIVAHKQQLCDYILSQGDGVRYQLLKEIHDNMQDSQLARVFHTSSGILKPQRNRGLLGLAENEYQRLHQNTVINSNSIVDYDLNPKIDEYASYQERTYAENQRLKLSASSPEVRNTTISLAASSSQSSVDNPDILSLDPYLASSSELDQPNAPFFNTPQLATHTLFFIHNKAGLPAPPREIIDEETEALGVGI